MGSIYRKAVLDLPVDVVWAFLERFADSEVHVFSMSEGERRDGDDRIITLPDGSELVEHNVTVDPARHRVVYNVPDLPGVTHHQAEMRLDVDAEGALWLLWTIDMLPHEAAAERDARYDGLFAELLAAVHAHTAAGSAG